MKKAVIKRKSPTKMITVVSYHPRNQEYLVLPMPACGIPEMTATVMSQYTQAEQKFIHIVTVFDGVCMPSAAYESEVELTV